MNDDGPGTLRTGRPAWRTARTRTNPGIADNTGVPASLIKAVEFPFSNKVRISSTFRVFVVLVQALDAPHGLAARDGKAGPEPRPACPRRGSDRPHRAPPALAAQDRPEGADGGGHDPQRSGAVRRLQARCYDTRMRAAVLPLILMAVSIFAVADEPSDRVVEEVLAVVGNTPILYSDVTLAALVQLVEPSTETERDYLFAPFRRSDST